MTLIADFGTQNGKTGYFPVVIPFLDLSSGSPTSWSWDFGDGETSIEQNPEHAYLDEGVYTVSLTVRNESEESTETKTDYVTIVDILKAEYELWGQGVYGRGTYHDSALPSESKESISREAIVTSFLKETV